MKSARSKQTARAMGTRAVTDKEKIGMISISKRQLENLGNVLLLVLVFVFTLVYAVELGERTEQRLADRASRNAR